jgi:putative peptidase M16 family
MLGDLVVAELLAAQRDLEASAGLFGPGDLVRDDLFVVVDDTELALEPTDRVRAASVADDDLLLHAVGRAVERTEAFTVDDGCLTRTVARDVVLRGEPSFAPDLVTRLRGLLMHPNDIRALVTAASARLASQPFASIRIQGKDDAA